LFWLYKCREYNVVRKQLSVQTLIKNYVKNPQDNYALNSLLIVGNDLAQ
jgi:hypothetical protein